MEDQSQLRVIEDQFKSLLLATKREGVEDLFRAMQQNGFFKASCRLHHNFEGGAAWYSMEVLLRMVKKDNYLPLDSIIIVALLHELYRIDDGGDATIPGARALAMLTKLCPQFKLRKTEYDAILWYNYTLQQLGRMGEDAKDALSNALRQSLRSAKLFSIHHPKDWEALEAAMQGKRRPRRDIVFGSGHTYASAPRIRTKRPPRDELYHGLNQGLNQGLNEDFEVQPILDESANTTLSIAELTSILMREIKKGVTNEEALLIRELVQELPINRYDVYLGDVDDSIKIAINAEIDRACGMRRYATNELAHIFSDKRYVNILNRNLDYTELFERIQNGYGKELPFKTNTLQKEFKKFNVRIW